MSILPPKFPICRLSLSVGMKDIKWMMGQISSAREEEIHYFEEEFAERQELLKAFYVTSAKAAFYETLQALNLPPKSRILMPNWMNPAMAAMVIAAGHFPRLVDVDEGTWTIGSQIRDLEDVMWGGVGALLISHMYGCPAPLRMLEEEANKRKIPILEDCTQGFGADCGGRVTGSSGLASFYSFDITNNLSTLGGGMLGVRGPVLADKLSNIRSRAQIAENKSAYTLATKALSLSTATSKYGFGVGVYPMLALSRKFLGQDMLYSQLKEEVTTAPPAIMGVPAPCQAALGRRMLQKVDERNKGCNLVGTRLLKLLKAKRIPHMGLPSLPDQGTHIFTNFVVTFPRPQQLAQKLFEKGIDTSLGYFCPIHSMELFGSKVSCLTSTTVSDRLGDEQLHLPVYPELTDEQLQYIANSVAESCAEVAEDMRLEE
ncbi:MAG: DegT/DnrJ/EryC1/StrS family aminotransferase [bacterium]|nr:DegT/DnrJ/EryC1/StrS family aminotransferase [bacterium]